MALTSERELRPGERTMATALAQAKSEQELRDLIAFGNREVQGHPGSGKMRKRWLRLANERKEQLRKEN